MSAAVDSVQGRWLLVSDIDDTLTGNPNALADLANALERAGDDLVFAVNSSRPADSVAATLADEFPANLVPGATITALGTEISLGGAELPSWQSRFSEWPHHRVFELLAGLGHRPHAPEFQTAHKVSFAVRGEPAQTAARRALSDAGIACEIIASGVDDFDVLPQGAGKAAATGFLAAHLGVDPSRLVVAGDSGNDLAMFQAARHRIAVGNARAELIRALESGSFYHARQAHAAGVHEGLVHFGVLPDLDRTTQKQKVGKWA